MPERMTIMDDFENVSKLVSQTGSTFEEARYAYEACGKDMLSAAVMLERAKKKNCSETTGASGSCQSYDTGAQWDKDKFKQEFRRGARTAIDCTGGFLSKLARNTVTVSGSREYFSVPVIAAVIILILLWGGAIPVVLISLLCGIRYTFSGPDLAKEYVFGFSKPAGSNANTNNSSYDHKAAEQSYRQNYETYDTQDKGFFNDK